MEGRRRREWGGATGGLVLTFRTSMYKTFSFWALLSVGFDDFGYLDSFLPLFSLD